jgi:hypothetical protein
MQNLGIVMRCVNSQFIIQYTTTEYFHEVLFKPHILINKKCFIGHNTLTINFVLKY